MLVRDILRLATRMFRTNRSRTLLTILGIGVGIGAILFLVSLGYGLQVMILEQITTSDALLSLDVTTGDLEDLKMNRETIPGIQAIPGVDKVSPLITSQVQVNIDDISSELVANFVDREFFQLDGTVLKEGDFYSDDPADKNKIILSSSALNLFDMTEEEAFQKNLRLVIFVDSDQAGDETLIRSFVELEGAFKIIGIVEEEASNYVYLPFSQSEKLGNADFSKLKVKVEKEDDLDLVRDSIIEQGYFVSALSDIIEQANQIFKVVQIVLASFGIVALIVSAIGMFNTMTIALLERTQEIGIMKALAQPLLISGKCFWPKPLLSVFLEV